MDNQPPVAELASDVDAIQSIAAVPTILDVICQTTGMRFAAVARVTESHWVACSVFDRIDFGLRPGDELKLETTICHEIRQSRSSVIIDHVTKDQAFCNHPTPAMYGFQSYISVPIILADGTFFGTLCAIDPNPAQLNTPAIVGMFNLFADLIAKNLDAQRKLAVSESNLQLERSSAELREQFMAILGHDLRTPMRTITCLVDLLVKQIPDQPQTREVASLLSTSSRRMLSMLDNLLDLTHSRLGNGLPVAITRQPMEPFLRTVLSESQVNHPKQAIESDFRVESPVTCDPGRIAQLFSNLVENAIFYGTPGHPVKVRAVSNDSSFELSVANAGDPIPPEAMKNLFHPFYRNNASRAREGLGLGLYIAKEIAAAHAGSLDVTSTSDETRFTFWMNAA